MKETAANNALTCTLQTNEHEDIRLPLLGLVWLVLGIEQIRKFVEDSLLKKPRGRAGKT